jgi:nucleoside-diphosphate-sugar epimerase
MQLRVFILGGTGSIGAPVLRELVRCGHTVTALARSDESGTKLASMGANVLKGDLRQPSQWVQHLPPLDAVVNVAGTFADDEEETDRQLLDHILPRLRYNAAPVRFIYTGGCWLYGTTDGTVTTEASAFSPLPTFSWAITHIERLLATGHIWPIVIHPAMVYAVNSGVFASMYAEAAGGRAVRVVGAETVRWPLVHHDDLAVLYRLALEQASPGDSFIGAAITGVSVGQIARALSRSLSGHEEAPMIITEQDAIAEFGSWAAGYGRDQLQSGEKARRILGWNPVHLDPLSEIARLGNA